MIKALIILFLAAVAIGCESENLLIVPGDVSSALEFANLEGRDVISMEEIMIAISDQIEVSPFTVYLADATYLTYSITEVETFLALDRVDEYEPLAEFRDCDDYSKMLVGNVAERFPGIPFGMIWLWKYSRIKGVWFLHSQNIFYDGYSGQIYLVEPLDDSIQTLEWHLVSSFILMKKHQE